MAEIAELVEDNPATAYERSDWPIGTIFVILLAILILLVITPVVLIAAFPRATSDVDRALTVELPEPRLQTDPTEISREGGGTAQRLLLDRQKERHSPHPDL